ncbi:TonB-dependent receptor [Brevundimonas nasdae]|uniref:TonB-dependent receptor n=1 Tax=Brevundimonas nasdae TaxID=172043 RepID=UPI003F694855
MRQIQHLKTTVSAVVIGAAAFGFAGVASAQQSVPSSVDDIIVTAQKREQSLQDVPIVVTTLSQELLTGAGVQDIKDLQILTPGMTVTSTQSEASTTVRIRGAGTVGDNPGLESSVGVVIDGVYRSRNAVGFGDLGELSRIEVLKGPQGTLFGKNTSAGVINIITERPSFTPSIEGELTGGNYGAIGGSVSATGPLTDKIAGRLFVAHRERDGFYEVNDGKGPNTRTDDGNQNYWTSRGQLLILPNDDVSIRLIADYSKRDEYCCAAVQTRVGPTQQFIAALTGAKGPGQAPYVAGVNKAPFSRLAYANRETPQQMEDMGLSAEATIDFPSINATLTSQTSWRDWSFQQGMDLDYTGADILHRDNDGSNGYGVRNLTQELRLAGTTDRFDWLVGLFATKEDIYRDDSYVYGTDYTPFLSFLLTAQLNAAIPTVPISPGSIPCFTKPGQTPGGFIGCLGAGGAGTTGPGYAPGKAYQDHYSQSSESVALFTNNTWRVTDAFELNMGLRYTYDSKRLLGIQDNLGSNGAACGAVLGNLGAIGAVLGAQPAGTIAGNMCLPWANPLYDNRAISEKYDDTDLSGTFKASYRFNKSVMAYVSYARGYKGAGYNMDRVQNSTPTNPLPIVPEQSLLFKAETVDSYEAGLKTTLFNRTMLLNISYFDQKFENFQLNTFLGTAFVVESIPELRSKGVDADMVWFTPIEGLMFQGGVTYTDAKYGHFTAADMSSPGRFPQLSLLPGARASFAPEWSLTGALSFDRSLGGGLRGGFNLSAKYSTEYNTGSDLLPYKHQDAFTVVNGRVSIGAEDERWTVDVWAQNLFEEKYTQVGFAAPLQGTAFTNTATPQPNGTYYNQATDTATYNAYLGAPRTWGVTLRVKY